MKIDISFFRYYMSLRRYYDNWLHNSRQTIRAVNQIEDVLIAQSLDNPRVYEDYVYDLLVRWGQNAGTRDDVGMSWYSAHLNDPRFPEESNSPMGMDWEEDQDYYRGPDYNFNDGDW